MAFLLKDVKNELGSDPMRAGLIDRFIDGSESKVLRRLNFIGDPKAVLAYNYSTRDTMPQIAERSLNQNYSASGSRSSKKTVNFAIMGGEIRTDMVLLDANANARTMEIAAAMTAMGRRFEKLFFLGDSSVDAKQFNGLRKLSDLNNKVIWAGANGGAVTQDLLDQLLDSVSGDNSSKVLHMSRAARRAVSAVVRTAAGGKGVRDAQQQLVSYNDAAIETIEEDETYQPIFTSTETRGSSNLTQSIYCVRYGGGDDETYVQGVVGNTFMRHRDCGMMGTYYLDVVDNSVGIESFHPFGFARLGGVLV